MRIAFWNTKRLGNATLIATLCREHDLDVLILAEPGTGLTDLLTALNSGSAQQFFPDASPGLSERLQILYRYEPSAVLPLRDTFDIAARSLAPPLHLPITLVAAHLPSKLFRSQEDQVISAPRLAAIIGEVETQAGHTRTVLIGD